MFKHEVLSVLKDKKLVAIIRGVPSADILKTVEALLAVGITNIEVTSGNEGFIDSLKSIKKEFGDNVLLGAGTIIEPAICTMAIEAGAKYIITPNFNPKVIETASYYGILSIIGAYTPTEISAAYAQGADVIKIFPLTENGVSYIKAIKGPFPYIPIAVAGGVSLDNIEDYIKVKADILGIGGNLVNAEKIRNGDFKYITETAKNFTKNFTSRV